MEGAGMPYFIVRDVDFLNHFGKLVGSQRTRA